MHINSILSPGQAVPSQGSEELIFGAGGSSRYQGIGAHVVKVCICNHFTAMALFINS